MALEYRRTYCFFDAHHEQNYLSARKLRSRRRQCRSFFNKKCAKRSDSNEVVKERLTISANKEPAVSQPGVNGPMPGEGIQFDGDGAGTDSGGSDTSTALESWKLCLAQLECHTPGPHPPLLPADEPKSEPDGTSSTLQDVLERAQDVVYEAREDTPGISFLKGDGLGKEWVPASESDAVQEVRG